MKVNWGSVLRWALVVIALVVSSFAAFVFLLGFSIVIVRSAFESIGALRVASAPGVILRILDLATIFAGILLWVLPPALAIGFALRARWLSRWQWGLAASLSLVTTLACFLAWKCDDVAMLWAVGITVVVLAAEVVAWICGLVKRQIAILGLLLAFTILFLPYGFRLFAAQRVATVPRRLWSVVLQKGTWEGMNTGSDFGATRQMVIAGDRVVVVFDAGFASYQGKEPMSRYRILSLDRDTGAVRDEMGFVGHWGAMPYLFGTSDGNVILEDGSLQLLTPGLQKVGVSFSPDRGRVLELSPDGSTLGWETEGGTRLLDATNFSTGIFLSEPAPGSVSREAALSNNLSEVRGYPGQVLVIRTDEHGAKFIFHDRCGMPPRFLSEDRILFDGCGKIRILDDDGKIVAERRDFEDAYEFAGVSRNGARFALQASDERGDPEVLIYETFYVYDASSLAPVATIPVTNMPERRSWTAFSGDGHLFAVGDPDQLSLYEIP